MCLCSLPKLEDEYKLILCNVGGPVQRNQSLTYYRQYTPEARGHLHARECHVVSHLIWIEGPLGHHKNQGGRSDHWQQGRYSTINARRRLSKWRTNLRVGQVQFDLERPVFDGIWWMTTQMKAVSAIFTTTGKSILIGQDQRSLRTTDLSRNSALRA